ncbi:ankyrin repeat-containing domain protein [Trichoderma chlorosporum]
MSSAEITFRVQGIPANASKNDAKAIIAKAFSKEGKPIHLGVHSLASDPYNRPNTTTKVATVSFAQVPETLNKRGEVTEEVSWNDENHYITVDSQFRGFTPLNDVEDNVIAISGLSSHPFGSWKARGGKFMWLRDELAKTTKNARILLYGYDTTLIDSESFQDIGDIATRLSSDINAMRSRRLAEGGFIPTPIVFIAHSLGGLVVKEAIFKMSNQYPDDFLSIYGLLFFGVPNNGIKTEHWMPIVDRKPNRNLISSLEIDSYYLRTLQENFNRVFCFADAKVTLVYETLKSATTKEESTGQWKQTGPSEILVNRISAIGSWSNKIRTEFMPSNQNHSELPKFSNNGLTPLIYATKNGMVDTVELLLNRGASTEAQDNNGLTALHLAGHHGYMDIAQLLLNEGADVTAQSKSRQTPIQLAAEKGHADMVKLLLDNGAKLGTSENESSIPLDNTSNNGHASKPEQPLDQSAIFQAKDNNGLAIRGKLAEKEANIQAKSNNNSTSLHEAAEKGQADIVEILLDQGADIETQIGEDATPLHIASTVGHTKVVKLLIDRGANIEAQTVQGLTPLHIASNNGRTDVLQSYEELYIFAFRICQWPRRCD